MWNEGKSVGLTRICTLAFMFLLIAVVATAPWLTNWFISISRAPLEGSQPLFMATIYTGALPAGYLLFNLWLLLSRIEAGQVFTSTNVERLRRISWCCFTGAGLALVSAWYYSPWLIVFVSAAFMGLIVRVVKNLVAQAVSMKDEIDHTI
ncbi:MAG TPA: DUF2975 domain-containing protein [Syntrophomonadaceae bacterium]|nr:DUF2975 domain-containing protein [Syntrophomonadaceae bacterium]